MKSVTELKRDAKTGKLVTECVQHYDTRDDLIPLRLQGKRKITGANTVAIFFECADGSKSELRIDSAKLIEYTDDEIIVYFGLYRDPTPEELKVLDGAAELYEKYAGTYNGGFYQVKDYYAKSPCPWMNGYEMVKGKKYHPCNKKVLDNSEKGEVMIRYKIVNKEGLD